MKNDQRAAFVSREAILGLLSDEEVARISKAESALRLAKGAEYVDLVHLERGVQNAPTTTSAKGRLLLRSSIRAATWKKILQQLGGGHRERRPTRVSRPRTSGGSTRKSLRS